MPSMRRDAMKFLTIITAMAMLFLTFSGCSASSRLTAANLTQPVMVGPVFRIGGDRFTPGTAKNKFDIWVVNGNTSLFIVAGGGSTGHEHVEATDTAEKADSELLMRVDSPDDRVMIKEIGFRSYTFGMLLILVNGTHYRSGVGMTGTVYGK